MGLVQVPIILKNYIISVSIQQLTALVCLVMRYDTQVHNLYANRNTVRIQNRKILSICILSSLKHTINLSLKGNIRKKLIYLK